jgi:hypothetical protein
MGTHKTTKGASLGGQNVPVTDSTTKIHAKRRKQEQTDNVLGVQKIKGALRQTRRLLAKVRFIDELSSTKLININSHCPALRTFPMTWAYIIEFRRKI